MTQTVGLAYEKRRPKRSLLIFVEHHREESRFIETMSFHPDCDKSRRFGVARMRAEVYFEHAATKKQSAVFTPTGKYITWCR